MSEKIMFRQGLATNVPVLDAGEPAFASDTHVFYVGTEAGNAEIGTGVSVSFDTVDCSDQIVVGDETHFTFAAPAVSVVAVVNGSVLEPASAVLDNDGLGATINVALGDTLVFLRIMVDA